MQIILDQLYHVHTKRCLRLKIIIVIKRIHMTKIMFYMFYFGHISKLLQKC